MIDIGANLTNKAFKGDLQQVLERAAMARVQHICITGTNLQESLLAAQLCEQYEAVFPSLSLSCTAGVHPHDAKDLKGTWIDDLELLHKSKFVKAMGETGLDFNRNYSPQKSQIKAFREQLILASRLEKPVFVHDRDSAGETLKILGEYDQQLKSVVIHCFTGTKSELMSYLDAGYYIGITGWVCDERRGQQLQELVPLIPDSKLMLETDAPWLIPRNLTTKPEVKNRCEPKHLVNVLEKIAQLRNQSVDEVRHFTTKNSSSFFSL